jgi:hypothetical protein
MNRARNPSRDAIPGRDRNRSEPDVSPQSKWKVDLRQTCTLKHIHRFANAYICHVTARDDGSAMVLASANKLKKGVRRRLLSVNGNSTPVAIPLYVRDKINVIGLAFCSRRNQYGRGRGSQEQMSLHNGIMRYYASTRNFAATPPSLLRRMPLKPAQRHQWNDNELCKGAIGQFRLKRTTL